MRIYYSSKGDQDPMLSETHDGMHALYDLINRFIESDSKEVRIVADQGGSPAPYEELLGGLCIEKAEALSGHIGQDRWLYLAGPSKDFRDMNRRMIALDDTDHTHLYSSPIALIIEVRNE